MVDIVLQLARSRQFVDLVGGRQVEPSHPLGQTLPSFEGLFFGGRSLGRRFLVNGSQGRVELGEEQARHAAGRVSVLPIQRFVVAIESELVETA